MRKKFLFTTRTAAYGTSKAQELLDILLMASAFEQEISLLFLDDGVFCLAQHQNPEQIQLKNFSLIYKALALYDIEKVYVTAESLQRRGLTSESLLIPVTVIENSEVAELMAAQDILMSF